MGAGMSEAKWRTCTDSARMLEFLRKTPKARWAAADSCTDPAQKLEILRGNMTDRKERLFLVACARSVWDRLELPDLREAVETVERFADGLVSKEELLQHRAAMLKYVAQAADPAARNPVAEKWHSRSPDNQSAHALVLAATSISEKSTPTQALIFQLGLRLTGPFQPDLLREIFGPLPFREIPFPSEWRPADVTALASSIYEERTYDRLPLLADALKNAGCFNEEILDHFRGPGSHVRGCWALDLVLGKA